MGYNEVIKAAREKKQLSQAGLARLISVSRSAISSWEAGRYPPTDAKNIAALEAALSMKPSELYKMIYLKKKDVA